MNKDKKIYDKNGTLLKNGDFIKDGYDVNTIEIHYGQWYICEKKDMWKIEEFGLDSYKDGILLVDFEKSQG